MALLQEIDDLCLFVGLAAKKVTGAMLSPSFMVAVM
jgi:hypothetical protein